MSAGYKYKIGDVVYIKDLNWFKKHQGWEFGVMFISKSMFEHCGKKAIITNEFGGYKYVVDIDNRHIYAEKMFETLRDVRKNKLNKWTSVRYNT